MVRVEAGEVVSSDTHPGPVLPPFEEEASGHEQPTSEPRVDLARVVGYHRAMATMVDGRLQHAEQVVGSQLADLQAHQRQVEGAVAAQLGEAQARLGEHEAWTQHGLVQAKLYIDEQVATHARVCEANLGHLQGEVTQVSGEVQALAQHCKSTSSRNDFYEKASQEMQQRILGLETHENELTRKVVSLLGSQ